MGLNHPQGTRQKKPYPHSQSLAIQAVKNTATIMSSNCPPLKIDMALMMGFNCPVEYSTSISKNGRKCDWQSIIEKEAASQYHPPCKSEPK